MTQVSFSAGGSLQQFANFAGTVKIFDGASLRFSSTSGLNNGGTNTTFDLGTTGNLTARNTGTVNVGALTGAGTITGASGADNNTTTFSIGAKSVANTYSGVISNSSAIRFAALTKVGTSSLTLTNANTYTGATNINAGSLVVNGSLGATPVTVGTNGTLGGTGSIAGVVTTNGTIAPGNSAGTLTVNNNVVLNSTATLAYELKGSDTTVGGGINDLLTGVVNLTLDGTLNVTGLDAFTGLTSGTWRLINYSGTLTNNTLNLGTLPMSDPDTAFSIDTATLGQVNLVLSAVPEPTSALLGLLASLGLLRRRRA